MYVTELPMVSADLELPLTWNDPSWGYWKPNPLQTAFIRLRMTVSKITSQSSLPQHTGLWVRFFDSDTLGQTVINALKPNTAPAVNIDDVGRGWFMDSVEIYMEMKDPRVKFMGARPENKQQTGSLSSTAGFNVSGGLFGESPTASVGYSESSTYSQQLNGITFYDSSDEDLLQYYKMTAWVGDHGDSYSQGDADIWSKVFHHAQVRNPPDECFGSNLPIISQAYWTVPVDGIDWVDVRMTLRTNWVLILIKDTDGIGDYKWASYSQRIGSEVLFRVNWNDNTITNIVATATGK